MASLHSIRDKLEENQVAIYFSAVLLGFVTAYCLPDTSFLAHSINATLALMIFITLLQVPVLALLNAFTQWKFISALLVVNFVLIPTLVALLIQWLPDSPLIRLGVLFVLLSPCIDYVVTFAHLGKADARLLLASTPILFIVQILLLPLYLSWFLGDAAGNMVQFAPFLEAFLWFILCPFLLAFVLQVWQKYSLFGHKTVAGLSILPVPATALVLFLIVATMAPKMSAATEAVIQVAPIYVAFAIISPCIGWGIAKIFQLETRARRAIAFSAGTRNSLVILPLAMAVPNAIPVLPAIIVTQTLIELVSELIYIRLIPKFSNKIDNTAK